MSSYFTFNTVVKSDLIFEAVKLGSPDMSFARKSPGDVGVKIYSTGDVDVSKWS